MIESNSLPYGVEEYDINGRLVCVAWYARGSTADRAYRELREEQEHKVKPCRVVLCRDYGDTRIKLNEYVPPESLQLEGYIVHSARTLNNKTTCKPVNNTFCKTEQEAVDQACRLARKWSEGHEGLLVLKAVKHVRRSNGTITIGDLQCEK